MTNDRETSPPPNSNSDPQRTAAAPAGPAAPEHEDDSQTHEDVEDTCHQGQMEDEVSLAVEFHVEDKEDSPEYVGLSEAEISKLAGMSIHKVILHLLSQTSIYADFSFSYKINNQYEMGLLYTCDCVLHR